MAVEHAHFHNCARHTGWQTQRRVTHVRGLFTKDGAQQFFFWRHWAFALWRNLAAQNITGLHFSADINNASFVKVLETFFAHVWNIAGDFFRPKLCVTRHHIELFDVNGGEHVIFHDALRQQDRVFEVVTLPWHEGHEAVLPQGQITQLS